MKLSPLLRNSGSQILVLCLATMLTLSGCGNGGSSGGSSGGSYQAAYDTCYIGTPALYSSTYCNAYANAIVGGSTPAQANIAGAAAAGSNVGNVGTGQPISSVGTPYTGGTGGTTGGTGGTTSGTGNAASCANQTYMGAANDPQVDTFCQLAQFDACLHRAGYNQYDAEGRAACSTLTSLLQSTGSSWRCQYCPYPF